MARSGLAAGHDGNRGGSAMMELLKKELRLLRPMTWLTIGVLAVVFIGSLMDDFPDMMKPWSKDSEAGGLLALILLFSAMTGANLLTGESNDGTLTFLDGLPLSRSRLFVAKLLAGFAVVALPLVLGCGLDFVSFVMSRQSTTPPFHWGTEALCLAQQCVAAFYLLSMAAVLSFTRQWYILAVGFVTWGLLWLRAQNMEWSALFDPYQLLLSSCDDGNACFAWRFVAAELGASACLLVLAWALFQSLGDGIRFVLNRTRNWRFPTVFRTCFGGVLAVAVWIGAFQQAARLSGEEKSQSGHVEQDYFGTSQTKRFDFVFRKNQEEAAAALIEKADTAHDRVTACLGASPLPGRIVADLGSPVMEHCSGQTNWTKIRVPLDTKLSEPRLEAVLGHETAHVYIERLSGGAMARHFQSTRFFNEGLATLVEYGLFLSREEKAKMRRTLAAVVSRGEIPFKLLADNNALCKERDANIAYPCGEAFCFALVDCYGNDGPNRLLRAFASPDPHANLEGVDLWRVKMQACGFDLEKVIAEYETRLRNVEEKEAAFTEKFPHLTAHVAVSGGEIVIQPEFKGTAPGRILCMVEPDLEKAYLTPQKDGAIHILRSKYPGPRLRYILGWGSEELGLPVFEKWVEADLEK
ncbi:MAG: ABC transporter permease [Chthoniobacteraceae bacterium]